MSKFFINKKRKTPVRQRFEFVSAEERPIFELVLGDKAKTTVNVLSPTKKLCRIITEMEKHIAAVKDPAISLEATLQHLYDAAAELVSNNLEGKTFTGSALEAEYGVSPVQLIKFYEAYADFIDQISEEKN